MGKTCTNNSHIDRSLPRILSIRSVVTYANLELLFIDEKYLVLYHTRDPAKLQFFVYLFKWFSCFSVDNAGLPSSNNATNGGFLSKRKFKEPVLHIFAHNKICEINHTSSNLNLNWLLGKLTQETQKGKPSQRPKGKWQQKFLSSL